MTTVAYKVVDGVMACDSCWTAYADEQQTSENKITRLASGALLGQAGDNDARGVVTLLDHVKTEKQLPTKHQLAETRTDFAGILVLPNGRVFLINIGPIGDGNHYDGQLWPAGRRGFAAIGSGGHIALGAMAAGKNAREAVAIACDWDINSKLPVHTVPLKEAPKVKLPKKVKA